MTIVTEIFKRDKMGRVRVTRARREALLNEFERGGKSGAQFAEYGLDAALAGIQGLEVNLPRSSRCDRIPPTAARCITSTRSANRQ
jgi:hypothetical protein